LENAAIEAARVGSHPKAARFPQKWRCPRCAISKTTSATTVTTRSAANAIISCRALNIR